MNECLLFSQIGGIESRTSTTALLDKYIHLVKWHEGRDNMVMDIGCGPGNVTTTILQSRLPENIKVTGCDVSDLMVKFATAQNENAKISFRKLDVSTRELPECLHGQFDQIFSFHCLNWVQDQRQAFQNISKMLKSGGEILITLIARNDLYEAYTLLKTYPKWRNYLKEAEKFIPPYQHCSEDAVTLIEEHLSAVGLQKQLCEMMDQTYMYDNAEGFKLFVRSVNPFDIPDELFDEYIKDVLEVVKSQYINETRENVLHSSRVVVISARKAI